MSWPGGSLQLAASQGPQEGAEDKHRRRGPLSQHGWMWRMGSSPLMSKLRLLGSPKSEPFLKLGPRALGGRLSQSPRKKLKKKWPEVTAERQRQTASCPGNQSGARCNKEPASQWSTQTWDPKEQGILGKLVAVQPRGHSTLDKCCLPTVDASMFPPPLPIAPLYTPANIGLLPQKHTCACMLT